MLFLCRLCQLPTYARDSKEKSAFYNKLQNKLQIHVQVKTNLAKGNMRNFKDGNPTLGKFRGQITILSIRNFYVGNLRLSVAQL